MPETQETWHKLDREDRFVDLSDYARPLALRVVTLLRDTPVRSVHVTAVFLLAGVAAGGLIAAGGTRSLLGAGLLIQVKNLLDAVDGSLARAQERPSRTGRFFDSVADFLVDLAVHAGLALALAPTLGGVAAWFLSGLTLLSALLQGSYYSFFTVAYRRLRRGAIMSRLDEGEGTAGGAGVGEPGARAGAAERWLHGLYLAIYGWQDRWVGVWVGWAVRGAGPAGASGGEPGHSPGAGPGGEIAGGLPAHPALFSRRHLGRVSLLGLGTRLLLASLACWAAALAGTPLSLALYALLVTCGGSLLLAGDLTALRRSARRQGPGPPSRPSASRSGRTRP